MITIERKAPNLMWRYFEYLKEVKHSRRMFFL